MHAIVYILDKLFLKDTAPTAHTLRLTFKLTKPELIVNGPERILFLFQILVFLKGFKEDEQRKLATILGIIFANGFCKTQVLTALFEEHLVKEG